MAFGLFKKRPPEPAAPALEPQAAKPAAVAEAAGASDAEFRQADPRTARTGTRRDDPSARARGQFGRRRRRGDGDDTLHHSPAHRRAHRTHQRRARAPRPPSRRPPTSSPIRRKASGRRCATPASSPTRPRRRPGSQPQCGSAQGILGRDRQCRQPDRADRQADHAAGAQLDDRGGPGRRRRARLCRGRHRGQGARGADPGRHRRDQEKDRRAAEGCRGLGRCRAPDLAGDRGDPAGFRERQRRGQPSRTRPRARCPTTSPPRRISSSRSATAPPRSTARPRKPKPMASMSPMPARPSPCSRKSSKPAARCCSARTCATTGASGSGCRATSRSKSRPRAARSLLRSMRSRWRAS